MFSNVKSFGGALKHSNFRVLWIGLTISRLGDEFASLALIWFVLQLTGSGAATGFVFLCFQIPAIITGPILGRALDRYPLRVIMGIDNFCRALITLFFPFLFWLHLLQIWHVYILMFLLGAFAPATEAGISIAIPQLVADGDLEGANALLSVVWETVTLIGPIIAGILIVTAGSPVVLLLDAASFVIMGCIVSFLPGFYRKRTNAHGASTIGVLSRIRFLFTLKAVLFLTFSSVLMLFIQGFQAIALSVYSLKMLQGGSIAYGLLMTAFGAGSLFGLCLINDYFSRRRYPGLVLSLLLLLFGLFIIPLTLFKSLPVALFCLILAGFFGAPFFVIERSTTQRLVPVNMRGEVFGIRSSLGIIGYPFGGIIAGLLLDGFSSPVVIALSCFACVIAGIAGFLSPTVRTMSKEKMPSVEQAS